MTVQPIHQVPLPAGADPHDPCNYDWQPAGDGEPGYRVVGCTFSAADDNDISTLAVQLEDGHLVTTGDDRPKVYIGHTPYDADAARGFANTILQAADLADEWSGRSTTSDMAAVAAVLGVVDLIHRKLRFTAAVGTAQDFERCATSASYLVTARTALVDALDAVQRA